jgi:hypothetical protein
MPPDRPRTPSLPSYLACLACVCLACLGLGCAAARSPVNAAAGAAFEPAPAPGAVETIAVPGTGALVHSKTALAAGELYLLRASGAIDVGGSSQDAEYAGAGPAARDEAGAIDVGIDVGRRQIHPAMGRKPVPEGPGRAKWFGPARADHTY